MFSRMDEYDRDLLKIIGWGFVIMTVIITIVLIVGTHFDGNSRAKCQSLAKTFNASDWRWSENGDGCSLIKDGKIVRF